jgi:hypothetical protein
MLPDSAALVRVQHLERTVFARSGRQIRELRVFQHEQGLVLRGRAPTYYLKQLTQHASESWTTKLKSPVSTLVLRSSRRLDPRGAGRDSRCPGLSDTGRGVPGRRGGLEEVVGSSDQGVTCHSL